MRVEPQNPIMHASGTGVRLISNNLVILAWVSTAGDALKDQMNGEAGLYRTGCDRLSNKLSDTLRFAYATEQERRIDFSQTRLIAVP